MKKQFDELALIADSLDQRGLHEEASLVDLFLYKQGAVFSEFEKEAVRAVVRALNELETFSLISVPGKPIELLGLEGRKKLLKGTVAEQYLAIYEWLDVFISEVLQPNAALVPDNEYYQTLLEFSLALKRALEGQYSRLLSVSNYYNTFKASIDGLITGVNSLTVSTNLKGDEAENIADKLDDIKQEYFATISPLKDIVKKGNVNLTNFEGILDNLKDDIKQFLTVQGEEGETLRSYLQDGAIVGQRKPIGERVHSFKWILENARQAGPKTEKMAEQYKALAELRREFQRRRLKSYTALQALAEALQNRYQYWMERYKNEGVEEFNVEKALEKYHGLDNILEAVNFTLEVYSPEKIEASFKGLSKVAQEFGLIPVGESEQVKEIENLAEKTTIAKDTLEATSQKWEKAVSTSQVLFERLNQEVGQALAAGHIRRDWDTFQKQISSLAKQADKQFSLIVKNNDKIKKDLAPKIESLNKVINILFKH